MLPVRCSFLVLLVACGGDQTFSASKQVANQDQGTGAMEVTPDPLVFTGLEVGLSQSMPFKVTNTGDGNLQVYKVDLTDSGVPDTGGTAVFYIEEEQDKILAADGEREFTVVATLSVEAPAVGEARIKTNDEDNMDFRLPLLAYPAGWDTGAADTSGGKTPPENL